MTTMDSNLEAKLQAQHAADEFRAAAAEKVQQVRHGAEDKAAHLRDIAESSWEDAKNRAQGLLREGEVYVRENPAKSVVTALGVGFVLGLLFRR